MKMEKLFESRDHRLFRISDGAEIENPGKLAFPVKWSDVEAGEAEYNEEFLAALRNSLKALEEKNEFVFIEPVADKNAPSSQFTDAMKHTARRIKDCAAVLGFAVPEIISVDKSSVESYFESLSEKHSHYVYFCKKDCDSCVVVY